MEALDTYRLNTFKLLNRYRYLRANMLAAYHGGSLQNRKRELMPLRKAGLVAQPTAQKDTMNYRYSPRVYELTDKSKKLLAEYEPIVKWDSEHDFWHQLMIADIVFSIEMECARRGLRFRHGTDLLDIPCRFPAHITRNFAHHTEYYDGDLRPDELFAIEEIYFVLEADRQTEPIERQTLKTSSYMRKLLQYRDVLKSKSYKDLIPNMIVLNVTTSRLHAKGIQHFMREDLRIASSSMLFKGIDLLGSDNDYPDPYTHKEIDPVTLLPTRVAGGLVQTLFDEPFDRVGHPPTSIMELLNGRTSEANRPVHSTGHAQPADK